MKIFILSATLAALVITGCKENRDTNEAEAKVDETAPAVNDKPEAPAPNAMITTASYNAMVKADPLVLVDFAAEWCGPCKILAPRIEALEKDMPGKFTVVKVDVDRDRALADSMNIQAMPTLMLYKNGEMVWRSTGLMSKDDLGAVIRSKSE
jgi:thioredoxin 1